jgi:hypothetical protein
MDGEIDVRKVTVTHFLAFAQEPVNGMLILSQAQQFQRVKGDFCLLCGLDG